MADSPKPRLRWLNPTVLGIGLASLCSDLGHEMATAAMPALFVALGIPSASAALGLIEGLADGLSSFAKLFSGLYSDRLEKRKPLAVAGYLVTALGMASFALATQWWHILIGRVGGWLGRGVRSPVRKVLLTEATEPQTYGRAFGFERAMDSAGAVLGPLAVLLILWAMGTTRLKWIFIFTLIPGVAAALFIWLMVREKPHSPQPHLKLGEGIGSLPHEFRKFLTGVGIAGMGDFSNTLLILWATQAWTPRFGREQATLLAMAFYIGYNIVYTLSCYINGLLADHFPKHWILAAGYALAVIPAAVLLFPGASITKFAVVFGFSGLYMGAWETVEGSTAATMLSNHHRGIGFGVLDTINGFGDFISSALVGFLWVLHPAAAMGLVIITSLAGAAIIAQTHPRQPPPQSPLAQSSTDPRQSHA